MGRVAFEKSFLFSSLYQIKSINKCFTQQTMGPRVQNKKREKHDQAKQQAKQQASSNERQFRCKCLKTYKSYPALYTHIKNKHKDHLQQYKSQSIRPKQPQNQNKGRPKKPRTRPPQADIQGDLLNIIELGVLQIEERLKNKLYSEDGREKFQVLTGNAKLMYAQLRRCYDQEKGEVVGRIREVYGEEEIGQVVNLLSAKDLNDLKAQVPVKIFKQPIRFKQQLIQHFNAATAAKLIIHLQLLEIIDHHHNIQSNPINHKDEITFPIDTHTIIKSAQNTLWKSIPHIVQTIRSTVGKWREKVVSLNVQSVYVSQQQSVGEMEGQEDDRLVELREEGEKQQREGDDDGEEGIMGCIDAGL